MSWLNVMFVVLLYIDSGAVNTMILYSIVGRPPTLLWNGGHHLVQSCLKIYAAE